MRSRGAAAMADDHFELRLAQESSAIRHEIAAVRSEMATRKELEAVRAEMATRKEVEGLRQEMAAGFSRLERHIADSRVDILKRSFAFWTGQCFVILGFLFLFLRNR